MSNSARFLLNSFLIGFTAAATLGPIALLCIQRTIKHGRGIGLASGFGVALADGVYGLMGALGLNALTQLLLDSQIVLGAAGGGVLIFLGIRAFRSTPNPEQFRRPTETSLGGMLGAAGSIFLLTLSNPVTIMFFSAVYAGLMVSGGGLSNTISAAAGWFALFVFAGSFSWWVILVTFIFAVRQRFKIRQLLWLNRVSGLAIAGFGVWVLVRLLVDLVFNVG